MTKSMTKSMTSGYICHIPPPQSGLLSNCCRTVVGPLSNRYRTVIGPLSDRYRTFVEPLSDLSLAVWLSLN